MNLPTGTVTFLFTDIEGSTKMWECYPKAMRLALARHDEILSEAIARHNGHVFKTVGDAFCAAFTTAPEALNAALEAHLALAAQEWGEAGPIRVRMGLHTGVAEEHDNDYFGPTLNRTARLQGIGHGQQTLLSRVTFELVRDSLPSDATLSDLGMHRLKDLATPENVWQLLHPSLPLGFPALKSLDHLPTNLPQLLTSFIGREKEMAEITQRLGQTRLLTLTGSGGTGKSRLSLQAAAEVLEQYPDGVWLVELAPLSDPGLVAQTVAQALSIREAATEPITKTLLLALKDKQMLLVLDNCEHVLDASAHLVDAVLKSCPQVSVLVSSREALGIAGESAYRVPSLSLPDPAQPHTLESLSRYEAARLFIERAVQARMDFQVTETNASALACVCQRLDGIPLAIELAAARMRALSVVDINVRLENRFRLLSGGNRMAQPRHQTLRALIDWSYDLLTVQEQIMLGRLSVFSGGWTLEAAEGVCADVEDSGKVERWGVLDLLAGLVDKSLLLYEEGLEGCARYRMLEMVREYALEKLREREEEQEVRVRHRDWYAQSVTSQFAGVDPALWMDRMEAAHDNLRLALNAFIADPEGLHGGQLMAANLCSYWRIRGYLSEGRQYYAAFLSIAGPEPTPVRAQLLQNAGIFAFHQTDHDHAHACWEEALMIYRTLGQLFNTSAPLSNLGNLAREMGDYDSARSLYEEALSVLARVNLQDLDAAGRRDLLGKRAIPLTNLGHLAAGRGDYVSARLLQEEALAIRRSLGYRVGVATSLISLGIIAENQSDDMAARSYFEEALAMMRTLGDKINIAVTLVNLGPLVCRQGDHLTAVSYLAECLRLCRELGEKRVTAYGLEGFAILALAQGVPDRAACLLGAAHAIRQDFGLPHSPEDQAENEGYITAARTALGVEAFARWWAEGAAMKLNEAIAYALNNPTDESAKLAITSPDMRVPF